MEFLKDFTINKEQADFINEILNYSISDVDENYLQIQSRNNDEIFFDVRKKDDIFHIEICESSISILISESKLLIFLQAVIDQFKSDYQKSIDMFFLSDNDNEIVKYIDSFYQEKSSIDDQKIKKLFLANFNQIMIDMEKIQAEKLQVYAMLKKDLQNHDENSHVYDMHSEELQHAFVHSMIDKYFPSVEINTDNYFDIFACLYDLLDVNF